MNLIGIVISISDNNNKEIINGRGPLLRRLLGAFTTATRTLLLVVKHGGGKNKRG